MQENVKPVIAFRISQVTTFPDFKFKAGQPAYLQLFDDALTYDEISTYSKLDETLNVWKDHNIDMRHIIGKLKIEGITRRFVNDYSYYEVIIYLAGLESVIPLYFEKREEADKVYNQLSFWRFGI